MIAEGWVGGTADMQRRIATRGTMKRVSAEMARRVDVPQSGDENGCPFGQLKNKCTKPAWRDELIGHIKPSRKLCAFCAFCGKISGVLALHISAPFCSSIALQGTHLITTTGHTLRAHYLRAPALRVKNSGGDVGAGIEKLDEEFVESAGAVTVGVDIHAGTIQETQPQVTERRLGIAHHEVATVLHAGASAGEQRGAIREVVDGVDVTPEGDSGIVVEGRAIDLFGRFQLADEIGQQFGVSLIAVFGDILPISLHVVTHVVRGDGRA